MRKNVLIPAVLALACGALHAEPREFVFRGIVATSLPMAPQGASVTGSFAYDTAMAAAITLTDPNRPTYAFAAYQVPSPLRLRVNGHTAECPSFTVTVDNNFGGNVEDVVVVSCSPLTLDGTLFLDGSVNLTLSTGPGRTQVLRNAALPTRLNVKRFDDAAGQVLADGSGNGTLVDFRITRIESTGSRGSDDDAE